MLLNIVRLIFRFRRAINMCVRYLINILNSPNNYWVIWPALGWGVGILFHGLNVFEVFNFFGPDWERRQIEKRLGKQNRSEN